MVRCLQHVEACRQLVPFETWETVTVTSAETVLEAFDLVLDWGQLSAWCSLGANTLLSLPPEHLSPAPFCPFCPLSLPPLYTPPSLNWVCMPLICLWRQRQAELGVQPGLQSEFRQTRVMH